MLQKISPLDALADIPTCRKLEQARAKLEESRQAADLAEAGYRQHCRRIVARGDTLMDSEAAKAEAEAIRTAAELRLAAAAVEVAKQSHGAELARHFSKNEAALEHLAEVVREALDAARTIDRAVKASERDGLIPSMSLRRTRRARTLLQQTLELF